MEAFLSDVSKYIFESHKIQDLKSIQIILPSRRAVFFLKENLRNFSDTSFLGPNIISIDDFIIKSSKLEVMDTINLYFEMYDLFKELDPNLNFEKYIFWAPILLKDFENIDMALVAEPYILFKYMSEVEAIKRWDLKGNLSANTKEFFDFFDKISDVFEKLRNNLVREKKCYKGLAYRLVAESDLNLKFVKTYFVGLNALSNAEETIVSKLVKSKQAECIWDTDDYYMKGSNKAGKKLRFYKSSEKFGSWNFQNNYLQNSSKNINIFGVSTESVQSKIGAMLAKQNIEKKHVLVLLNENQFHPILKNLPSVTPNFNVTMGVSLKNSNVFSFLEIFIKAQSKNNRRIIVSRFLPILNNKFVKILIEKQYGARKISEIKEYIKKENLGIIDYNTLKKCDLENSFLKNIFEESSVSKLILNLKNIFLELVESENLGIDFEFLVLIIEKLSIIQNVFETRNYLSISDFKFLIDELVKSEKVPFLGDTKSNLQVMSLLETRCLDFETVTLFSMNEGNLPASTKSKSFIPFDAATIFGLPVYSDQDAIMAYHFFRLLQRAENVNIIYAISGSNNGVGVKEKSRFLFQLEDELVKANKNIKVNNYTIDYQGDKLNILQEISIKKTDEIIKKIIDYVENRGFSPTSISVFLACELKFYWQEIERNFPEKEVESNFKANVFGNILHYYFEYIEKPFEGKEITKADFEELEKNIERDLEIVLNNDFGNFSISSGINLLQKEVIKRIIQKYFEYRFDKNDFPEKILYLEKRLSTEIEWNNVKIKLKGNADKISEINNIVYINDYKSGSSVKVATTVNDPKEYILKQSNKIILQLLIYKYLYEKSELFEKHKITIPRIIALKNLENNYELLPDFLKLENESEFMNEFIIEIVEKLTNMSIPFSQTLDSKNCANCNYISICNKKSNDGFF